MSELAGQLRIEIDRNTGAVAIRSTRPVTAARVFAGRSASAVARGLPTLYSLCGTAQAVACTSACERATAKMPSASIIALRGLLQRAETIKEHLWRLLLDWPKALDRGFNRTHALPIMAKVMRALDALRQASADVDPFSLGVRAQVVPTDLEVRIEPLVALIVEHVLGEAPSEWLQRVQDADQLARWAAHAETSAARLVRALLDEQVEDLGANPIQPLPMLSLAELETLLAAADADRFVAAPVWRDQCFETTPYARTLGEPLIERLSQAMGNGLLPRLAGLLVELALSAAPAPAAGVYPSGARSHDDSPQNAEIALAPGVGLGAVQAARGLLAHRIELSAGVVTSYRILAPTEWNFHPEGVVARGLSAIAESTTDTAALARRATLFITAIDPCVDYRFSVS